VALVRETDAELVIADEPLDSPDAMHLIAHLNAELSGRYPEPGATHFRLDSAEVISGRGAFLVARLRGVPIGCGAIRIVEAGTVEVKRMYVDPEARGGGVGRRVLAALEERAQRLGATRALLETGVRQPEALALYERCGYRRVEAFGEYRDSPLSVCMAKEL
jgi:putative acetyltransferase